MRGAIRTVGSNRDSHIWLKRRSAGWSNCSDQGDYHRRFTDDAGKYSIRANDQDVLVISYIGYIRQEIPVNGQSSINVSMEPSESTLEEVVVTGYGTQKAQQVTSAITSVKAEDFNVGQVNDPTQLIQGKVAGLNISKIGGDPNGGFTLRLRGISTFGANASPLVVIDGVIGAELNSVDPSDIADISVLKDGSAAAIYGSRASSGVIIITTKKGVAGSANINYNGFVTIETVDRTAPFADRATFLELKGTDAQDNGATTNWIDEVTRTGISQVHNLSLSGGMGSTSYRAALNYRGINGVGLVSGFEQLNGRINLTQKALDDRLTISLNVANTQREADFGFSESFRYANLYNPTSPVFSDLPENENFGGYWQQETFDYFNPRAIADQGLNEGILKTLLTTARASYEIVDGLTVAGFVSRQKRSNLFAQFYSREAYFRGGASAVGGGVLGRAQRFTEDELNDLLEATVNYARDFGTVGLDLLGGYSYNNITYESFGLEGTGLPSDAFTYNSLAQLEAVSDGDIPLNVFGGKNNYKVIGFFGRARVNIDDTYNLTASLRYEGSTRFGTGNQWGLFPAISGSVMLSNLFEVNGIDELKIRAGYGVTGALPGSSYESLARFGTSNFFPIEGTNIQAIGPQNNANQGLRWERKGEINVGVDFQLFDYKLFGSVDFFSRDIRDLLVPGTPVNSPPFLFPDILANLNSVALRSSGLELTAGYRFESGNFSWEPNLALTRYFTVFLDSLPGVEAEFPFVDQPDPSSTPGAPGLNNNPAVLIENGSPLGQFYGFQVDVAASEEANSWVIVDIDEDGNTALDPDDQTVIGGGTGIPNWSLGLNNRFAIGDLDFTFFLRGDFGHYLMNMNRVFYESVGSDRPVENIYVTDKYQNIDDAPMVNNYYIENASFLVLDNAQIGYNFSLPKQRSIRAYVAGQNLFWITGYTGIDPSVRWADPGASDNGGRPSREFNASPLVPGLARRNTYFTTRTITVGVNMTL